MITNYALTSSLATQRQEQVRAAAERHSRLHVTDVDSVSAAPRRSRRGWVRVLSFGTQPRLS